MALVLIVEDDEPLARLIRTLLSTYGYDAVVASNVEETMAAVRSSLPDVMILDVRLGAEDGRDAYRAALEAGYRGKVLVLSAFGAERTAREIGAHAWLAKPFDPETFLPSVARLLTEACASPDLNCRPR